LPCHDPGLRWVFEDGFLRYIIIRVINLRIFKFDSIGKRIQFGYLIMLTLFSVVIAGIIYMLFDINQHYNEIIKSTIQASQIQITMDAYTKNLVRQLAMDRPNMYQNSSQVRTETYRHLDYLNRSISMKNSDGIRDLSGLRATIDGYFELLQEISDNREMSMKDVVAKFNEIRKNNDFIVNGVQRLITSQLIYHDQLMDEMNQQVIRSLVLICAAVLMMILLIIVNSVRISGDIAKTLKRLSETAKNIAAGDLSIAKIEVKDQGEVRVLAHSFNKMTENLRNVMHRIQKSSTLVANAAEFLRSGANQSSHASEQIAAAMQQVSQGAAAQSQESQKTVSVIHQLQKGNQQISDDVSAVLQSAQNATQAANSGNEKLMGLLDQITIIERKIDRIQAVTRNLERQSDEIGEILQSINQIAEQTNLLSLNASIEAARAGELGKGFAVVADEVRKLADESTKAVGDITAILQVIQTQSREVAASIAEGVEEVKEGTTMARVAGGAFQEIVRLNEDVNRQIRGITGGIYQMVAEMKNVQQMSGDIATIAEESSAGCEEVAASVEEQTAGLQEILASASALSEMARELEGIVKEFTL
jgi:methyl-accepting chemotaxis protein